MSFSDILSGELPAGEHMVIEERNGLIEATHWAHIAVVDKDGNIRFSSGDPDHMTYSRSCIKPIQALPILYMGAADQFDLTPEEIAMTAASHSGERIHIDIVERMMGKIGITEADLACGGHPPFHKETARELCNRYTRVHDNCSGKHTGALSLCKHMGWDTATYTDVDHPLNTEIVRMIRELTSIDEYGIHVGKDGCDIPNYGLPISKMAQLFAILADPSGKPYEKDLMRMRDAFIEHPKIIAGTDRFDTIMMEDHPGKLISKAGAAGLQTMALPVEGEWLGVSIKIEDGSYPAVEPLSFHILKELGSYNQDGKGKRYDPKIIETRSKKRIGSIRALGKLK